MTTLGVYAATVVDGGGNVMPLATVTVRTETTLYGETVGALATLTSDRAGAVGISNPVTADENGFVEFYCLPGPHKITASSASGNSELRFHPIVGLSSFGDYLAIPITTVADIRTSNLAGSTSVQTLGYTTAGDGAAGLYRADTADTTTADDGFLVIVSNDSVRFKLVIDAGEPLSILLAGVDRTGVATASAQCQAVNDALPAVGGTILAPAGTYLLDVPSGVILDSNVTLKGEGAATLFDFTGDTGLPLQGINDGDNIEFRDFKMQSENHFLYCLRCTNIRFINLSGNGLMTADGELSQLCIQLEACIGVLIENPNFDDYFRAIYLERDTITPSTIGCNNVTIRGGTIQHITATHGLVLANPAGINVHYCLKTWVEGTTFKNIKAPVGGTAGTPGQGYGVYQGDTEDGFCDLVSVKNCKFIEDDGFTVTRPMAGVLVTSSANVSTITNNEFIGALPATSGGGKHHTFSNNSLNGSWIITSTSAGVAQTKQIIHHNSIINVSTANYPILIQAAGSVTLPYVSLVGNELYNTYYGVYLASVQYAHIVGNILIDVNSSGTTIADLTASGGFNFAGCPDGFVDGNDVKNITDGRATYGVVSSVAASSHTIKVTPNNKFKGMLTGAFYNGFTGLPAYGNWDVGTDIKYWDATTFPGCRCTATGTMGTLVGVTGGITTGTPDLVVSDSSAMIVGHWITIVGVTGKFLVTAKSGTAITLASNADATVAGAAVAFSAATFKTQATMV